VITVEAELSHRETPANLAQEALIAIATLSRWSLFARREFGDAEQRARALVFLPIIGLIAGVVLAFIDRALVDLLAPMTRSVIVIMLIEVASGGIDVLGIADLVDAIRIGSRPASTGLARIGPIGALAAIAWFIAAAYSLAWIHDPASRSAALVMASMLSRWAIIPIGYGLRPLERWGLGVPYEGPIRFREFSISSAVALGLTMALYENVGLAVIVALALTILAMRLVLSRRLGGAAGYALAGGMAVCELVIFAVMAALTR
jgi:adenosylcobinamide-GDP ribazoletransferase